MDKVRRVLEGKMVMQIVDVHVKHDREMPVVHMLVYGDFGGEFEE